MIHLGSTTENSKWLIQCERYLTRPPTKSEIHDWLVSCNEHKSDYVLLIITNTLTSDVKDWLEVEKNQYRFKVFYWELMDLQREVAEKRKSLASRFPTLFASDRPVIEFYKINQGYHYFGCSEFEEVDLRVYNCRTEEEAKEKVRRFFEVLREHDPSL